MIEKTLNEIQQDIIEVVGQIDQARSQRDSEELKQARIRAVEASYWLTSHTRKITKRAQNVNEYQQQKKKLGL
jgi:hypothetical protein